MKVIIYAVYRGDKFLAEGTALQLAKLFGIKLKTIKFWATPSYLRRLKARKNPTGKAKYAVRIED